VQGSKERGTSGSLRYAGLGIQLAATVAVGVLVGQWADHKMGTAGVFTILGALLGFGGTLYYLIRDLSRADKGGR
jgi:F0F1-type ATP synthase assembly protein I